MALIKITPLPTPDSKMVWLIVGIKTTKTARYLLVHASCPFSLWGYALLHAALLTNLYPHPILPSTTPTELWTSIKPDASFLRLKNLPLQRPLVVEPLADGIEEAPVEPTVLGEVGRTGGSRWPAAGREEPLYAGSEPYAGGNRLRTNLNRDLPHLSLEDVKRAILQEDFRRRELASADGAGAASIGQGWSHAKSWPHLAKKRGTASGGARGSGGMERFMTTKLSTEELRQAIAKLVVTCDFPFQKVESEAVSVPCLVFWQYVVDYFMLLL
ncbi:unnamed protein product [Closterium sp. NIES-53]